jgi:hypothetical protein
LSTFKAISSFWSLDTDTNKLNEEFVKFGHILVNSGFPDEDYKIERTNTFVSQKIRLVSFINNMADGHIEYVNGWDYIDSGCNYGLTKEPPRSFGGLSGGGIWAVKLKFKEDMKEWDIHDFALIGTTFYQSPIKNEMRLLRGHFIDSIYNQAWNNSQ